MYKKRIKREGDDKKYRGKISLFLFSSNQNFFSSSPQKAGQEEKKKAGEKKTDD